MSTGPSCRARQIHEAGFYRSDAEFRALIVAFVQAGVTAGQPVILGYDDRKADMLREWLPDPGAVTFVTGSSLYASPARAIAAYRQMFEQYVAAGATQIRIAGDVPHEGNGRRFAGWDRYESAVNMVWDQFPVWSRCLYDTATAPAHVLEAATRTHSRIVLPSGEYLPSGRYQHPADFEPLRPDPDPLQRSTPLLELADPAAAQARHAVASIAEGQFPRAVLNDLVQGVSEAVSNAWRHGRPPVTVRVWAAPGRAVVTVHDTGPGPADPLVGLAPATARPGREHAGLWIIQMLDLDTALTRSPDGFTVRLAAGQPA